MGIVQALALLEAGIAHPIPQDDSLATYASKIEPVSYTHLRAHETVLDLVCRLLLEKKKNTNTKIDITNQQT